MSWPADLTRLDDPAAPEDDRRAVVEAMDDDALRAFVEKLTGKKPHHKAGRPELIEAALACA
ncbi:hypothetical protein [Sphingosinicella xenopeptidilytica]|uniref:Uncharacterized protein n=1 Tax=Sphingosinicella xenopeptidilytica TaxID=364098 RepID=A0ABW3C176_SPHXN